MRLGELQLVNCDVILRSPAWFFFVECSAPLRKTRCFLVFINLCKEVQHSHESQSRAAAAAGIVYINTKNADVCNFNRKIKLFP